MFTTQIGLPLDEFIRLYDEQPFELIDGERIPRAPSVFGHCETIHAMFRLLDNYAVAHEGNVCTETTFVLPTADEHNWVQGSRIPDIMFYVGKRIADYKHAHPDHRLRPLALVPDVVIEVVSPNDKISEMDAKIDLYFADGVRMVIQIDPQRQKAVVYRPDVQPLHLTIEDTLEGGDILPGFTLALKTLFE